MIKQTYTILTCIVLFGILVLPGCDRPPMADAGADQTVNAGDVVTLDGSLSTDHDVFNDRTPGPLSFSWVQAAGTPVVLSGTNTATPTFTAPNVDGALAFHLTVTDDEGNSATDTVEIIIIGAIENLPPMANAGPDQTVEGGAAVTLDGSDSSDPDDSDSLTFSWIQTSGTTVSLSNANTATPAFTAPNVTETLTFELTVADSNGGSDTDTINVDVEFVREPPIVDHSNNPFELGGFTLQGLDAAGFNHPQIIDSLDQLIKTGANNIIIQPQVWIKTGRSNKLEQLNARPSHQLTDIGKTIKYLKQAHINVAIKPQLLSEDGTWSGRIDPENPDIWFQSYQNMLLEYAKLAEQNSADALYLTNEIMPMVRNPKYKDKWVDIIDSIKDVFHGSVSVNSVFTAYDNEVMSIPFADQLDFVGVSLYCRFTGKTDPTVEELVNAWYVNRDGISIVKLLRDIHALYGKEVMISEIGFRSFDGANMDISDLSSVGAVDLQEQADLFEALMRVLTKEKEDWLKGVSIWGWFTDLDPTEELPAKGCGMLFGEQGSTIQNKPSEALLTNWFRGIR